MNSFDMSFYDVGNPMFLGMMEELQEEHVNEAINYIYALYPSGKEIPVSVIDYALEKYDIDFDILPSWLADKFSNFDVI